MKRERFLIFEGKLGSERKKLIIIVPGLYIIIDSSIF